MGGLRWGLCCQFIDAPIKFRTATHRYVSGLEPAARAAYLRAAARDNARALAAAVRHCHALGIGAFRVNSQILPLGTHPESGYTLDAIDPEGIAQRGFAEAGALARELDVRLSFHPDQFVVLNSERAPVVESAVREVDFQAALAERIGADTIVVHGGGVAGGTAAALERLARGLDRLGSAARARLALENDDRQFSPADLLPLCRSTSVPLVYDVHHHRCRADDLTPAEATAAAAETWRDRAAGAEQWVHLSSPRDGWSAPNPRPHADYVDPADVPADWLGRTLTIDVEAKMKERAVLAIQAAVTQTIAARPPAHLMQSPQSPPANRRL